MRSVYKSVIAAGIGGLLAAIAQAGPPRPLPDFGLMYNNDGGTMYGYADTAQNTQYIDHQLDLMDNTPIKTFMWCIGSDVLNYPTQAGSNWGWRSTPYDNSADFYNPVHFGREYAQEGYDPIRVVADKVKSMGGYFIPSLRMNDDHFVVDPYNYPTTGQFWLANTDKTIGTSPVAGYDYSNLLSYSYQAVRDYRMSIIDESIDRYSDVMDGYELDFNRVQIFFPPGQAQSGAHLITDMVQQVRQKLDQVATDTGRPQYLFVRVPPTLSNNAWAGLEVDKWIQQGLVDVVIPSVLQTMSHDVPVNEFVNISRNSGTGVQVAPAIYPRTNYGWNLDPRPGADGSTPYSRPYDGGSPGSYNARVASVDLTRGAASNYRYMGASGMQMYNYGNFADWPASIYDVADALGSAEPTLGKNRVFAVTPAYFIDNENTFEYAKQIPYTLSSRSGKSFNMVVGDDINRMIRERPDDVILRLGLTDADAGDVVLLNINGHTLHATAMGGDYYPLSGAVATSDGPQAYFQVAVDDLRSLRQGNNAITVTNESGSSLRITDIQLGVFGTSVPATPGTPVETRRQPQSSMLRQVYHHDNGNGLIFTVNNRPNNGYSQGSGGVYLTTQPQNLTQSYSDATGLAFDQAMYYPSVEGQLQDLDYQFWLGKTSSSRPTSIVSLLLMQSGKVYALSSHHSIENGDAITEEIVEGLHLRAEDFLLASLDGILDPSQHPDFSAAGEPLYFGVLLIRSSSPTDLGGIADPRTDLDDFVVTFHSIPEPHAAIILLLGISCTAVRRRREVRCMGNGNWQQ